MIKAIFFDVDGTLLNRQSQMENSTIAAIKQAQKQGILCGIATGRGPTTITPIVEKYNLDFAITYNGQYIYDKEQTVISARPFDKSTVRKLARYADENNRDMAFCGGNKIMGSSLLRVGNTNMVRYIAPFLPKQIANGMKNTWQHVFRRYKKANYSDYAILREPIYQVLMISPEKEQVYLENLFYNCALTRSNPYSIDIIPKGGSKLEGIKRFCTHYEIDINETMAFGDSWNDMEMLGGVGASVAMGNAVQELKDVADFTTTGNDKDGIARAMLQFHLLEETAEVEALISDLTIDDLETEDAYGQKVSLMPVERIHEPIEHAHYFLSEDKNFNRVKEFHHKFDDVQELPKPFDIKKASNRAGFKAEELVEFLYAASNNDEQTFYELTDQLKADIDKAVGKIQAKKEKTKDVLVGEVDAMIDLLYFTYGSFVLLGVDPAVIFEIVHQANMGKLFPDGKAHYDKVTGKVLKPDDWEERFAPESQIKAEILKQYVNREKMENL